MRLYRDRAVVLRQHKLGEADRIITLLTRDHGLVRAVAKGVRRTRSKFGARRAVADGNRPRELVLAAYLLRAMGSAGWAPALTECARCAAPGPHRAFHVAAGGSVCVHCRPSGSVTPPQGVLDLMSALHEGDWEYAEASSSTHRSQASGLVAAHLQWHLERQLRTLPLVERMYRVDQTVADLRVPLVGQDMAHGYQEGQGEVPAAAPG